MLGYFERLKVFRNKNTTIKDLNVCWTFETTCFLFTLSKNQLMIQANMRKKA